MKKALLSVLLYSTIVLAQQSTPKPATAASAGTPATREDVLRLFSALRLESQMDAMQETIRKNFEQLTMQAIPSQALANLSPARRKELDEYLKRTQERASAMYPVHEMLEDFIPVYQKNFSKEEIDAVVQFYKSPAGQTLLDKQPTMMKEGMAVLMPKLEAKMKVLMDETERDVDNMLSDRYGDGMKPHPEKRQIPDSLKN